MKSNPIHGALFGVAIGDALGVPAEFTNRETLKLMAFGLLTMCHLILLI